MNRTESDDTETGIGIEAVEEGPMDTLVRRLNDGDPDAAEALFRNFEPYLRMAVRRNIDNRMRAKFDSADIVQSALADVIVHFRETGRRFENESHVRNFLNRVVINRFHDRFRRHRREVQQQKTMMDSEIGEIADAGTNRPSREVAHQELWESILLACPPKHHDVLRLRRDGLRHNEIAERLGLHPSTVRRVITEVARRLQAAPEPHLTRDVV